MIEVVLAGVAGQPAHSAHGPASESQTRIPHRDCRLRGDGTAREDTRVCALGFYCLCNPIKRVALLFGERSVAVALWDAAQLGVSSDKKSSTAMASLSELFSTCS